VAAEPSDRNLLFGILAVQTDLVSKDALVRAMSAWVLDKTRPLGDLLVEQGALSAEHHALLEALVRAHLQAHGGDPQCSLASLSTVPSVCRDLEQIPDADLHASLARVADRTPDDAEATRPEAVGAPTSAGPRFRILRPHAKGGLGEVFVARDEELRREVALKEIRRQRADDPASRARFLLEAEITGGLEHPGIVPVYGLGRYPDGRPFYAMRLVRGDSLKDAIEYFHEADRPGRDPGERTLALRGLLRRFVDVCNAVDYAHSRGVLHRDLKPGNVMLGKYGETLVVDWGLAKVVGHPEGETVAPEGTLRPEVGSVATPTEMGQALGTPAYMSPEQAAGRWDAVGPASDVYGLGATLYCLLTGRPPFQGPDHGAILRQVQEGVFPPPRQVNPAVPAALEAVCLRAMRRRPEERYATPRQLADEVERYLADEPVVAYPEPVPARLRRWARRHRPLVAGSAALLLTAVVALAVGLVVVRRQQLETERQRQEAVTARQQADEQSRLALDTLNAVVFDIQTKLENVPAAHRVRREMLQTAIAGLQKIAASAARAPEKGQGLVAAHLDIGDIFLNIGGAGPGKWTDEARHHYQVAHDLAAAAVAADPASAEARRYLALCHEKRGDMLLRLGDVPGARDACRECLELRQRLADDDPDSARARRDLAVAHEKLGDALLQLGDHPAARDAYQKGLEMTRRLADADPTSAPARRDLAVAYNLHGNALMYLEDPRGARHDYQKGLEINQRLAAADRDNAQAQRDLAVSHEKVGDALLQLGDVRGARDAYGKDLEITRRLAQADPGNLLAQRDLAVSSEKVGDALLRLGDVAGARDPYQKDLEISKRLAEADPDNAQAQIDLVVSHYNMARCDQEDFRFDRAVPNYESALTRLRDLDRKGQFGDRAKSAAWRRQFEQALAQCRTAERAVTDLDFVLKQPRQQVPQLLDLRVRALCRRGQHAAAAATADRAHQLAGKDAGQLYQVACWYALCSAAVAPGKVDDPLAARAVAVLREAVRAGYHDAGHVRGNRDLDPLRSRDDYRQLMKELDSQPKGGQGDDRK
jgi:serine/threonine-protein kinase